MKSTILPGGQPQIPTSLTPHLQGFVTIPWPFTEPQNQSMGGSVGGRPSK